MILTGQKLIDTLHFHCENAKHRIWIASPFIGSLKELCQILSGNWMRANIDFRILTDIDAGFICKDTYNEIKKSVNSEIKTLLSLHAKIYIIDDWCLLSSANLTGTAFSRRYEVGQEFDNIKEIEKLYEGWWEIASIVNHFNIKKTNTFIDYKAGNSFSKKCSLPKYQTQKTDKFLVKCDRFIEFARFYEKTTGRNQQMVADGFTLYQEVDYFFNYLYHDAPNKPSKKYKSKSLGTRKLSERQKEIEVTKYFKKMSYNTEEEEWRLTRSSFIQKQLNPKNIKNLSMDDVKEVLNCFHCLYSYPINRTRILNNNKLADIKNTWNILLNTGEISSLKIGHAKDMIKYFGDSCASELIAWYMPAKYPMINLNSESGMRFFGIDV